jgi:hypothetical protein
MIEGRAAYMEGERGAFKMNGERGPSGPIIGEDQSLYALGAEFLCR